MLTSRLSLASASDPSITNDKAKTQDAPGSDDSHEGPFHQNLPRLARIESHFISSLSNNKGAPCGILRVGVRIICSVRFAYRGHCMAQAWLSFILTVANGEEPVTL